MPLRALSLHGRAPSFPKGWAWQAGPPPWLPLPDLKSLGILDQMVCLLSLLSLTSHHHIQAIGLHLVFIWFSCSNDHWLKGQTCSWCLPCSLFSSDNFVSIHMDTVRVDFTYILTCGSFWKPCSLPSCSSCLCLGISWLQEQLVWSHKEGASPPHHILAKVHFRTALTTPTCSHSWTLDFSALTRGNF